MAALDAEERADAEAAEEKRTQRQQEEYEAVLSQAKRILSNLQQEARGSAADLEDSEVRVDAVCVCACSHDADLVAYIRIGSKGEMHACVVDCLCLMNRKQSILRLTSYV